MGKKAHIYAEYNLRNICSCNIQKKFSLSLYYIQFMTFLVNLLTFFPLLAGCANGCSGKGQCTLEDGEYRCDCKEGWAGSDCSIALELNCKDNIDNDNGKFLVLNLTNYSIHSAIDPSIRSGQRTRNAGYGCKNNICYGLSLSLLQFNVITTK